MFEHAELGDHYIDTGHAAIRRAEHDEMFDEGACIRQDRHMFLQIEPGDQSARRVSHDIDVPGVRFQLGVFHVFCELLGILVDGVKTRVCPVPLTHPHCAVLGFRTDSVVSPLIAMTVTH